MKKEQEGLGLGAAHANEGHLPAQCREPVPCAPFALRVPGVLAARQGLFL
jgi:hypothetical protein